MYGTVARLKVKPGHEEAILTIGREVESISGSAFQYVYKLDNSENEFILVVGFDSKESYDANASSPEQHDRYLTYMQHLESDPEWNDGEVVVAETYSN